MTTLLRWGTVGLIAWIVLKLIENAPAAPAWLSIIVLVCVIVFCFVEQKEGRL